LIWGGAAVTPRRFLWTGYMLRPWWRARETLVIKYLLAASSALALVVTTPAAARHGGMSMTMPMPAPKAAKKAAPKKAAVVKKTAAGPARRPAAAVVPRAMDHSRMDMPMAPPTAAPADHSTAAPMPMDMPMPATAAEPMAGMDHGAMPAALGPYASTREASGTSWQPDSSEHSGWMIPAGEWTLMLHGHLDLIADTQSGPRGDDKLFAAGMLMGMGTRTFANGNTLQFRGMVSPDPLMGKSGYPLLLASGETANGTDRLVDRQHPHDLFMELSGSYSIRLADKASAFLYAGLPGEPAFGPPAFMHRQSIGVSPEAPISHHWLDSTHITFGVVTAGVVAGRVKVEASRFNGREPDQHRYDIETGPLDSSSVRVSWNPTDTLSLQASWAHLEEPEQLEPGVNQRRWSASASYTRPMPHGWWASTIAWGRKTIAGHDYDAAAVESSLKFDAWTLFGRGEVTQNNELLDNGRAYTVGKVSLGLVRDFPVAEHLRLGLGGLYAVDVIPHALRAGYGDNPRGAMGFLRVKID
jgi:hypothetical protein